jgi:RDD family
MPSSPAPQPSWKQEVNSRLAEHKSRKGISVVDQNEPDGAQGTGNSRAAEAAARVAARYAQAPSFSEMQAAEARAALRVAEAATRAALHAQAAAQAALKNLEASDEEYPIEASKHQAAPSPSEESRRWQAWENPEPPPAATHPFEIRWEPDMPEQKGASDQSDSAGGDWWAAPQAEQNLSHDGQSIAHVEAAQPIHANLIEFPRELVATRRMRPRLTESYAGATEPNGQLSIFEVDPSSISIDPAMREAEGHLPSWSGHEWAAIELDEHRDPGPEHRYAPVTNTVSLDQAPFGRRLMATMVDIALILGVVCSMAALAASKLGHLPGMKASELTAFAAVAVIGVLYECLFLLYAKCTPGMRYAELSLCTFDDEYPTREQMKARLVAMLLSLLPMGLGMLWAIFDEDNMTWHDRHSRTYMRLS